MFCVAPDGLARVVFEAHMKNLRSAELRSFSQEMARALAYGCVLGALGLACDRGAAKQGEVAVAETPAAPAGAVVPPSPNAASPSPAPQADAAPGAPAALAGKPSYQEEGFELSLQATGPFAVGKPAEARVVLVAKGDYKVNDQYPFKLTLSDAPGLELPAKVVTRDAMTLEKKQGIMKVAFTPKSAGEHALSGRFSFSVCTEERCLIEKRDLTLPVSAK